VDAGLNAHFSSPRDAPPYATIPTKSFREMRLSRPDCAGKVDDPECGVGPLFHALKSRDGSPVSQGRLTLAYERELTAGVTKSDGAFAPSAPANGGFG
jgi:hypothetical protein